MDYPTHQPPDRQYSDPADCNLEGSIRASADAQRYASAGRNGRRHVRGTELEEPAHLQDWLESVEALAHKALDAQEQHQTVYAPRAARRRAAAPPGGAGRPFSRDTICSSHKTKTGNDEHPQKPSPKPNEWLNFLREHSSIDRVRSCGTYVDFRQGDTADVVCNQRGKARFVHVHRCGLRWNCSFCGPRKEKDDRLRLMVSLIKAVTTPREGHDPMDWSRATLDAMPSLASLPWSDDDPSPGKYQIFFLTPTGPHQYGDELKRVSDDVVYSWNYTLGGGRRWGLGGGRETWTDVFGVEGFNRCFDLTVGRNGWHPHLHAALIVHTSAVERAGGLEAFTAWLRAWFFRRWDYAYRRRTGVPEYRCSQDDDPPGGWHPPLALCQWEGDLPEPRKRPLQWRRGKGWRSGGFYAIEPKPVDATKFKHCCPECSGSIVRPDCVSMYHGIDVVCASDPEQIATYLTSKVFKTALELTSGHRKLGRNLVGGIERVQFDRYADDFRGDVTAVVLHNEGHRTPWQLLDSLYVREKTLASRSGRKPKRQKERFEAELNLWHEYEQAMKGRRAMQTSKGYWSHPDFGLLVEDDEGRMREMTRDQMIDFVDEYSKEDEKLDKDDERGPMLQIIQWLYRDMLGYRIEAWGQRLDAWALEICEEAWPGLQKPRVKGYEVLKEFVDYYTTPVSRGSDWTHRGRQMFRRRKPPSDIKAALDKLVDDVEDARERELDQED